MSAKIENKAENFLEQVRTGNILSDRQRIYAHVKKHPGITMNDLSRALKMLVQTVSARLSELMDLGVIEIVAKTNVIGFIKVTSDSMLIIQDDPIKIAANADSRRKIKFKRAVKALLVFKDYLPVDVQIELNKLQK